MSQAPARPLSVFLIAGEESGDVLGAGLMRELGVLTGGAIAFTGIGGPRMEAAGLASLFPMDDITAIGVGQVVAGLPRILKRLREAADAVVRARPDVLVLIDAPDFTHRVAHKVRSRLPDLPIVKYVAPTVWVWRPGRAKAMKPDVDRVLAVLPFEPEVMARLDGPPTTYVGHPLLGMLDEIRPNAEEALRRDGKPPLLLVLPGSRRSELQRLGPLFGDVLARLVAQVPDLELVLPTLPRRRAEVGAMVAGWTVTPRIVVDEAEKHAAFRRARAAFAASGTVTLELALAGIPSIATYRVHWLEARFAYHVLNITSAILPNLILGEKAIPEYLQWYIDPPAMAAVLARLIEGGPEREAQLAAFERLGELMGVDGETPSRRAARAVLEVAGRPAPTAP
ncbi:lipid-A-disaccharide synthase [Ancylobacter sonchi]|uniref:lipid-A-disaccharide synthase n=1 Tax=Ancylobacter sonchi TaxID=1937790 RepID=UPI001BD4D652|nr:lipid-A-disaccharide synthase [Ancylobacter sonchi]MBS7535793.1 lipid-A-disaccharide synthase [Ancylobacter sonchi]